MASASTSAISRSNKESLEDCMCTICLCILIQPVTLPCGHELCMPCFKQTVAEASLSCPLCRTRISTWARKASKAKTLVDQKRWEQIQRLFPQRVQRRLDGLDDETDEDIEEKEEIDVSYRRMVQLSKPGEIRQEYEAELKRLNDQQEEERRQEEEASAVLIHCLRSKEAEDSSETQRQKDIIAAKDAELAQELGKIINEVETETPINRLLQEAKDNYPNRRLHHSNSSKPSLSSRESFDKGKPPQVKNNKTLETFFRRLPAGGRTSGRCLSEPKAVDSERPREKSSSSDVNSTTLRSVSAPVRDKENLPQVGRAHVSEIYEAVDIGDVYSRESVVTEEVEIGQPYAKDRWIKRSESVTTVHSDGSDSVILCDQTEGTGLKDGEQTNISHFKPIQSSPKTPPCSVSCTVPIEPCVVRITPRYLFSTNCLSSTSFPVISHGVRSTSLPPCHSRPTMGAVTSTLLGEKESSGPKSSLAVNGVGHRDGRVSKRPRSTSPPTPKVLSPRRHMSYNNSHRSPYARASLDDFRRRENPHTPNKEVVSDSEMTPPCSKRHATFPVNELSRAVQSGREMQTVLGYGKPALDTGRTKEGTVVGPSLRDADCRLLNSRPCNDFDNDVHSISSTKLLNAKSVKSDVPKGANVQSQLTSKQHSRVRPASPQPSTSAMHTRSELASSEAPSPSKPVGIFNPATVPAWSEAFFVDTVKGKGKRLIKKSANSSVSDRNCPKQTDKSRNCSRIGGKEADSVDSSVSDEGTGHTPVQFPSSVVNGAKREAEKCVHPISSTVLHTTPQKGHSSGRTLVTSEAASFELDEFMDKAQSGDPPLTDKNSTGVQSKSTRARNAPDVGNIKKAIHLTEVVDQVEESSSEAEEEDYERSEKIVRRVRRQGRGVRGSHNPPEPSEPLKKSLKTKKSTKPKSVESEKSQSSTNTQKSIKDWFSPKQTRSLATKTSHTSKVGDQRKTENKERARTISTSSCDRSVLSSSSSSAATSPQKLGLRTSNRTKKLNSRLDSFLLNSKLQQLQASPSKESDASSSKSSPCKCTPSKSTPSTPTPSKSTPSKCTPSRTTPSRGQKRSLADPPHKTSPAKVLRLTPSKTREKACDSDCHSTFEECYSSEEDEGLDQEEKDLRMARRLQRQFDLADKLNLKIVRFKGTDDQYSLRASRSDTKS